MELAIFAKNCGLNPPKRYLITSALPYANGPLHIGHLAGAFLPADTYVRYLRLRKRDVVYVGGSDEHGAAITIRAKKDGTTPKAIVDKYHEMLKKSFEDFGISFDVYHRTSSALHHETSQSFFKALHDSGAFVEKTTEQYYDHQHKQFLADRYITGECPNCHYAEAYGDQCENCGTSLSPKDLINPISTLSGEKPELKSTSHWFLPMGKHEEWLEKWIKEGLLDGQAQHDPKEWKKHVTGQCLSWIDGKLGDRAITRDLEWGVPVPLEGADGKVLYVWLDAPIGYVSATKKWSQESGKDWQPYWQDEDTRLVHFIGKDNIVFHCIIFPIILKLKGDFVLPQNVPANEFLNLEGQKISTSRNWAIWLHEYLEDMPDRKDELRYVLNAIAPETSDSEFTWKDYQARINNELVAIFGNFVNRAVVLTHKYFDGVVPAAGNEKVDEDTLAQIKVRTEKVEKHIEAFRFREAQAEAMVLARAGNKYLADLEPWKLAKSDLDRTGQILNTALQLCAASSVLMQPFLPVTCEKLQNMLQVDALEWDALKASKELIQQGHQLNKAELLFAKMEDEVIEAQRKKLASNDQEKPKNVKPMISFEDFEKLDLRTGTIKSAEPVPKTDKLLQLSVDMGDEVRTIVSGIAKSYDPEEIVGKQVTVLTNLAPRKIRGVESQGMILMADEGDDGLAFISPEKEKKNGTIIR